MFYILLAIGVWILSNIVKQSRINDLKKSLWKHRDIYKKDIEISEKQIEEQKAVIRALNLICENYEKHFGIEKASEILKEVEDKLRDSGGYTDF